MIKILYIYDMGVNTEELHWILDLMHQLGYIELTKLYIRSEIPNVCSEIPKNVTLTKFDVLIYQTFPHENHSEKWNSDYTNITDAIFLNFKGFKILHDAHDSGNVDAYKRFNNKNIPRIKAWPSYNFMNEYNVIMTTSGGNGQLTDGKEMFFSELKTESFNSWKTNWVNSKQELISYIVSYGYHEEKYMDYPTYISVSGNNKFIRENTRDILKKYNRIEVDMSKKSQTNFYKHLSDTLVSISVPGWGEGCLRQYEAPLFGCLNLLHESIVDIKLLPHADLIDGVDFLSFNLQNLEDRLDFIFDNKKLVDTIRFNGKEKLHLGYDLNKSVELLNTILKQNV